MPPPPALPRGRVLVVDDDGAVRTVCTALLHALGYCSAAASSGRMAIELLSTRSDQVQLVLLDCKMPGMSGVEVLQVLKATHPKLPVLLMSGMPGSALHAYLDEGADGVLCKPFGLSQLDHSLRLALRQSLPAPSSYASRGRDDPKSGVIERRASADELEERGELHVYRVLR